jgi:HJR/Mrr/RecB family endonuclease
MEIVVSVLFLLVLLAVGFVYSAIENAAKRKVTEVVDQHMSALVRRRTQLLMVDPYGTVRAEKWIKEVEYFFNTQISGTLRKSERAAVKRKWPEIAQLIESLVAVAADKAPAFSDVPVEQMKPFEFENYCAVRLQRAGWTARATKASGDQGVDVIAEKGGTNLVLQCKLYSKPIGNKAVQEVAAGRLHYGTRFAAVVSNQSYTPSAQ